MASKQIYETLAARRIKLGLTQRRAGLLIGEDQPTVSRAEQGRSNFRDVAERLDKAFAKLERERDKIVRVEADRFWRQTAAAPGGNGIIKRLEGVARELLQGSLSDVELAERILDCLPKDSRDAVADGAASG